MIPTHIRLAYMYLLKYGWSANRTIMWFPRARYDPYLALRTLLETYGTKE